MQRYSKTRAVGQRFFDTFRKVLLILKAEASPQAIVLCTLSGQMLSLSTCSMDPVSQFSDFLRPLLAMVMYQLLRRLKIFEYIIRYQAGEKLIYCDDTIIASLHFVSQLKVKMKVPPNLGG